MFGIHFKRNDSQDPNGRPASGIGSGEDVEILFLDDSEDMIFSDEDDIDLGSEY